MKINQGQYRVIILGCILIALFLSLIVGSILDCAIKGGGVCQVKSREYFGIYEEYLDIFSALIFFILSVLGLFCWISEFRGWQRYARFREQSRENNR